MTLAQLGAKFLDGSCGTKGAAIDFDCPCGCGHRRCIPFKQALDGTAYCENGWDREGTTLEDLTLHPSIEFIKNDRNGCGWHGHITRGHAIQCR